MSKRALIFGINGQDGSYLCDILLEKGYQVFGLVRHSSYNNTGRIAHNLDKITLIKGDICDILSVREALSISQPDYIFHMADQDSVGWSQHIPYETLNVTTLGTATILIETARARPEAKIFVPTSATIFRSCDTPEYRLTTHSIMEPNSPYALSKMMVRLMCDYERRKGLQVYTGIMFNHDSPRRSDNYVLQRIYRGVQDVAWGKEKHIKIGSVDSIVDVGYAREYMEGVVYWLENYKPDELIFATGKPYTVYSLIEHACNHWGVDIKEKIVIDSSLINSNKIYIGDTTKASHLGWKAKTDAKDMFNILLYSDEWRKY